MAKAPVSKPPVWHTQLLEAFSMTSLLFAVVMLSVYGGKAYLRETGTGAPIVVQMIL